MSRIATDKILVVDELDHASRWWIMPALLEVGT